MRNRRKSAGPSKYKILYQKLICTHAISIYISIWSRADNGSDGIVYTNLDFCWWDQAIINTICVNGAEVPIAPNYPKLKWYVWRGVFCTRSMSGANEICVTYIYIKSHFCSKNTISCWQSAQTTNNYILTYAKIHLGCSSNYKSEISNHPHQLSRLCSYLCVTKGLWRRRPRRSSKPRSSVGHVPP